MKLKKPQLVKTLVELISSLGKFKTSETIAKFLLAKNIKGKDGSYYHCPLANYFAMELGLNEKNNYRVGVTPTGTNIDGPNSSIIRLFHPAVIMDFIHAVDENRFPELIEENNPTLVVI